MDSTATVIPGRGTVLFAPVDTDPVNIDAFSLTDPKTYTGWTASHTSREDAFTLTKEGGEVNQVGSWEDEALRISRSPVTLGFTVNKIEMSKDNFELAFGENNQWDAATKSLKIEGFGSAFRAVMAILIDGTGARMGFHLPNTEIFIGEMPAVDVENFYRFTLQGNIRSSEKLKYRMRAYTARPYAASPTV